MIVSALSMRGGGEVEATQPPRAVSPTSDPATATFAALLAGTLRPDGVGAAADTGSPGDGETSPAALAAASAAASGTMAAAPASAAPRVPSSVEVASAPEGAARAADPQRVQRSLGGLAPEFARRLARVVERMRDEHGHRVEVTETLRSQLRQDFLYEQGRTRPGPVVTWTRSSNHATGRAADLLVDGSYDNPEGYRHLAQIAAEEGLRTLGPADPGHVELPRNVPVGDPAPATGVGRLADALRDAGYAPTGEAGKPIGTGEGAPPLEHTARVAEVARAASPAPVADVATVAQVASVAPVAPVARAAQAAEVMGVAEPARVSGARGRGTASGEQRPATPEVETARVLDAAPGQARPGGFEAMLAEQPGTAGGADVVGRLARIMEVRDAAPSAGLDHVVLRLDNAQGGEDRIRVELRGGAVGATIDAGAAGDADRLLARLPELRRALERQGLEAEGLTVRSAAASREVMELVRSAAAEVARPLPRHEWESGGGAARDRWSREEKQEAGRNPGDSQERSRREQKGGAAS